MILARSQPRPDGLGSPGCEEPYPSSAQADGANVDTDYATVTTSAFSIHSSIHVLRNRTARPTRVCRICLDKYARRIVFSETPACSADSLTESHGSSNTVEKF